MDKDKVMQDQLDEIEFLKKHLAVQNALITALELRIEMFDLMIAKSKRDEKWS